MFNFSRINKKLTGIVLKDRSTVPEGATTGQNHVKSICGTT